MTLNRSLLALAAALALCAPIAAQPVGDPQTITVVDSGTACVTAPRACAIYALDNSTGSLSISISGTWTGTLTFEGSNANGVFTSVLATNLATAAQATTTTANGLFTVTNAGVITVRVRATAAVTGTAIITAAKGLGFARASTTSAPIGTGGASGTLGGTLFTSTTAVSTTDLLEDTLASYTMPANTLAVNGRGVRITAWGNTAANANSKTVRVYFGTSVPAVMTTSTSGANWRTTVIMTRTGAAAQTTWGETLNASVILAYGAFTATEALTSTVLIKATGQGATTIGDVTLTGFLVEAI